MHTSYQEQMEYLDFVLRRDVEGKPREIRIREMAAECIKQVETYSPAGWTIIVRYGQRRNHSHMPTYSFVGENDALPSPRDPTYASNYKRINVRLVPALQGSPYVAQVLAEQQLRVEWP